MKLLFKKIFFILSLFSMMPILRSNEKETFLIDGARGFTSGFLLYHANHSFNGSNSIIEVKRNEYITKLFYTLIGINTLFDSDSKKIKISQFGIFKRLLFTTAGYYITAVLANLI